MTVADRRRRERKARRIHILDAAEKTFLEQGFDNVTVDDIAAKAEVAKGTLYLYFKNKNDLFVALMLRRRKPILEAFGELQADATNGLDLVARLIRTQQTALAADPPEFRKLFLRHIVNGPPAELTPDVEQLHKMLERIISTYINAIVRGQQDGSIRKDVEAAMVTAQIWGGVIGALMLAQHQDKLARRMGRPIDEEEYGRRLVDLIVRSIQAQPSGSPVGEVEA